MRKHSVYAVGVDKYGEAIYWAASAQAARSQAWHAWKTLRPDLSFAQFVKMSTVRKKRTAAERAA